MDDGNSVTTKLLTLLNVSATKVGKRKRGFDGHLGSSDKLNKRRSIAFAGKENDEEKENDNGNGNEDGNENSSKLEEKKGGEGVVMDDTNTNTVQEELEEEEEKVEGDDEEAEGSSDSYEQHFGNNPAILTEAARNAVDSKSWKTTTESLRSLGSAIVSIPESSEDNTSNLPTPDILERLKTPFQEHQAKSSRKIIDLQNDLLSTLSTHRDLYLTNSPLETRAPTREAIALHALNHITKIRRRVLKNNERLNKSSKDKEKDAPNPEDVQDQGFTRPTILILLPFRNSAISWYNALTSHTPTPPYQILNKSRFLSEYGLPKNVVDKLASAENGTYPEDHVETFKGNVDDNFRVGVKVTRKSVKMFSEFYGCDIVLASPLGLRRSIEKEKHADYLSSIELLIIDQMDALTMQNWDHVKFILSHINKLPKESHDTDFSRIKSWYLDGHAAYLRQSITLTAYETPETRSLYNSFTNISGKIRTSKLYPPISVPEGIDQQLIHFDCTNPLSEPDKRFHHFTTQLFPQLLKSAIQSTNTIIFVPSSFDFIRLHNWFRKESRVSFAILSEYSTNQDISRARQAFFKGTKSFLLISERFHFYKRYKIRGIKNILFYSPPEHSQYYTEFLSYPFLDQDVIEPEDVTVKMLYTRFDWLKLERILGSEGAMELIKSF